MVDEWPLGENPIMTAEPARPEATKPARHQAAIEAVVTQNVVWYPLTFGEIEEVILNRQIDETLRWVHDEWLPELQFKLRVLLEIGDVPFE